jgi:hypothetical protein
MRSRESRRNLWKPALAALGMVFVCGLVASAASYARTTLRELTTRSVAVVEIQVVERHYPPMKPGDHFPRTHVDVKVLKTLKGKLSDNFQLDLPGGIDGDSIGYVPDSPDFRKNERAIVFVKEPDAGHFMVQDLGLGKFSIVEREGKTFVENPTCPGAIAPGQRMEDQKDVESTLLTKSIPYATFCSLIEAYADGRDPGLDPSALAARLTGASVHAQNTVPAVVADARAMEESRQIQRSWLMLAIVMGTSALIAAFLVARRRKAAVTVRNVSLLVFGAMTAGAVLGGAGAHAFVTFDQKTIWDLDTAITNKVAGNKIIWGQTASVSKSNPDVFTGVQGSFDRWASVTGSRLAFTKATSSNTSTVNSTTDGENIIAWSNTPSNDFSSSTLAITFSSFSVGAASRFRDGDIIFNDRDFQWGGINAKGNSASVSLHEIGHFIGLNHTTDKTTIMFPFDGGLTNLSADELAAAQALYPGANNGPAVIPPTTPPPAPPKPPVALADASPKSTIPGVEISFTSAGSAAGPSGAAIDTFAWSFGDGATASGPDVTHAYNTSGTFSVGLIVTDENGQTGSATVTINVGSASTPIKAQFKLQFKTSGKDTFSATISDRGLSGLRAPKGSSKVLHGSITIGDQPWLFDFDNGKLKSVNRDGPKISVNDRSGTLTVQLRNTDLRDVLGGHGAINDDISGESVDVPVQIWFGDDNNLYVFGEIKFTYSAKLDKSGTGKF